MPPTPALGAFDAEHVELFLDVAERVEPQLVDAADGLAIIEDYPVLQVGRRRGAFEISRSQREGHGTERLRES